MNRADPRRPIGRVTVTTAPLPPGWLRLGGVPISVAIVLLLTGCFPHEPGPRLQHFSDVAPSAGEPAPTFELHDLEGVPVDLAELVGTRPIVLQLGSHTCPVYRGRRHGMRKLYEEYRDRVDFFVVYTLEAHPVGANSPYKEEEWVPIHNRLVGIDFGQPETFEGRLEHARTSQANLEIEIPMLVDGMDDAVWQVYGRVPSPGFVIDTQGTVALAQVWIDPKAIREVLEELVGVPR